MDNNIKCSNSIVSESSISDNYFDWEDQFPFGGFDIIIGNPPHGASFSEVEKKYINENYKLKKHHESCKSFFFFFFFSLLSKT